jgi:hypothetical protein
MIRAIYWSPVFQFGFARFLSISPIPLDEFSDVLLATTLVVAIGYPRIGRPSAVFFKHMVVKNAIKPYSDL